jgi:hypothetical protein
MKLERWGASSPPNVKSYRKSFLLTEHLVTRQTFGRARWVIPNNSSELKQHDHALTFIRGKTDENPKW